MMHPARACLLAVLLAVSPAIPAEAAETYFRTPSGNIYCAAFEVDGLNELRCDIREYRASLERPADCELDWGDAFAVNEQSESGQAICHGDTVIEPSARSLGYGRSIDIGGITCLSEERGLTCQNGEGHGFFLSKAKQSVF